MGDFEQKFIKPIVDASYPATLAALSLTVSKLLMSPERPLLYR